MLFTLMAFFTGLAPQQSADGYKPGQMAFIAPDSTRLRNVTNCPGGGPASAEFIARDGKFTVVEVSSQGRTSTAKDRAAIDAMLTPLRGMDTISIACQPDKSVFIGVLGTIMPQGQFRKGSVIFRWSAGGAELLTP